MQHKIECAFIQRPEMLSGSFTSSKKSLCALIGLLALVISGSGQVSQVQTQTVSLSAGWNLVAFQVIPANPAPAVVFGTLGQDFVAAWTFNAERRLWSQLASPGSAQSQNVPVLPMENITLGRGYWVYMNSQRAAWQIVGSVPAITPGLQFTNGWNLVGIPTGTGTLPESVNMLSVLAVSGLNYDMILKWEAGLYRRSTPDDQDVDDFTTFDANKGHWIHITSNSFLLQPTLLCSVRTDVDVEPQGNYPSFEDLRVSPSPRPLSVLEQTHLVMFPGEDEQQIGIGNVGGGILLWDIQWTPRDAANIPWLQFSALRGVTTIENDVVKLYLDRKDLVQGTYTGTLTLRTTAGNRIFELVAHVPSVSGEWRGQAQIAAVNGKRNEVPEIDLHLDFYEDPAIPGLVRGLIDSRNALLWPVDVPLIGHITTSSGNSFSLGGAYVLPPGDQNNPPYNQFNSTLEDVDWNCNGQMEAVNPFPFPIYRAVAMQGQLTSASARMGYAITGTYNETIYGILRTPIQMQGTFSIRRENSRPFVNRRPVSNVESPQGTQPVVLKSFKPTSPLTIQAGASVTNALSFVTDMVLQDLRVELDLEGAPADVKLSLQSPSGQQIVLHDRANIGSLRSIKFPDLRRPKESLGTLVANGTMTKGVWKLLLRNFGSSGADLHGWSLQLQGQPVFDVAGRITTHMGSGLPAQVFLDGLPISETVQASPDGSFLFRRLPGIPVNFSARLLGYEVAYPGQPGLAAHYTTPIFPMGALDCLSGEKLRLAARFRPLPGMPVPPVGEDGFAGTLGTANNPLVLELGLDTKMGTAVKLLATPSTGPAPLPVQFSIFDPTNRIPVGTTVTWDFGDGAIVSSDLRIMSHTYASVSSTGFQARVSWQVSNSVMTRVYPMPSPGLASHPLNFFQAHFTSGGTIPFNLAQQTVPSEPYLMVQQVDCASFDIDRAPLTSAGNRAFSADGMTFSNVADGSGIFKGEDNNYQVEDGTGPGQWELAGLCGWALEDTTWHPYPRLGATGECRTNHFRMICNIGPQIIPSAYSLVASSGGPLLGNVPAPPGESVADGIAKTRAVRVVSGPLAAFWKVGDSQ